MGFVLPAAVLATIAVIWLGPLGSSLWLDETVTFWFVQEGLGPAFERAQSFSGASPVYYVVPWLASWLGGTSEIALRLPSVAAAVGAAFLLYRMAARYVDRETAWLAVLVFACIPSVAFAAADARPYALALFFAVGSGLALLRFLERGRVVEGVAYALAVGLLVQAHYLSVTLLAVHAAWVLMASRAGAAMRKTTLAVVAVATAVAVLPAVPHMLLLRSRSSTLLGAGARAGVDAFLSSVFPPLVAGGLMVGYLIANGLIGSPDLRGVDGARRPWTGRTLWLALASWMLVPPAVLFIGSRLLGSNYFVERYFIVAMPALALVVALTLRALPAATRLVTASTLALMVVVSRAGATHEHEDWRGASAAVARLVEDSSTLVLVQSGLREAAQIEWLDDPLRSSYLLAPVAAYPMPGQVAPLPSAIVTPEAVEYIERLLHRAVADPAARLVVVTRDRDSPVVGWIEARLQPVGFRRSLHQAHGEVGLAVFDRTASHVR